MKILIFTFIFGVGNFSFANSQNEIRENVNTVELGARYNNDYDTSKFRIGVMQSSYENRVPSQRSLASSSSIKEALKSSSSIVCDTVKKMSSSSFNNSSEFVVTALKKEISNNA